MNGIYWYNCIDKSKKHKGNLWMIAVVTSAGKWIETVAFEEKVFSNLLFPVRERGLKPHPLKPVNVPKRCSPCGNVD